MRRKGYQGTLTALGTERTKLRSELQLAFLEAEFVLGDPADSLESATRTVRTASGRRLSADAVVVATGVRPRELPGQAGPAGVHVLRTVDDAVALRADLRAGARVVVVGDGVRGAEIAATARTMGADVTLAGPGRAAMAAQLGPRVAGLLADLHTEHGVRLRLGTTVGRLTVHQHAVWSAGSGPVLDNGVVCDATSRAAEGIYAVGDVSRWHHDAMGSLLRLEIRTNATEQAGVAAANILGAQQSYTPISYVRTDQFDARIQVYGVPPADAEVCVVEGDEGDRRFVALHRQGGRVRRRGDAPSRRRGRRRGRGRRGRSVPGRGHRGYGPGRCPGRCAA
nr:FAD-dependent oxidoreductase [Streptomyces roseochromogenus]